MLCGEGERDGERHIPCGVQEGFTWLRALDKAGRPWESDCNGMSRIASGTASGSGLGLGLGLG